MGVGSEHEGEESVGGSAETRVEIRTSDVVGGTSSGKLVELSSGIGDDDGDSIKKGAGSIKLGR